MANKTKLIEVALPLEVINRESGREKSIKHGHPSTLHMWWARRPLAAARAVLFAQLVDDPSAHPDLFPTEDAQKRERERLHKIIERLVVWENIRDEHLLSDAYAEILKSTDNNPPSILDPFAGGGTIPLEAQRLGLRSRGSDLNPVAVLINKALIDYPPRFAGSNPVYPGVAESETAGWLGSRGLAADLRAYGQWMREEAERRVGHLYPMVQLTEGQETPAIAWIWARTVTCPNPACRIEAPLVRSWWLSRRKGQEAFVVPHPPEDGSRAVTFTIGHDPSKAAAVDGTVGRQGAQCIKCNGVIDLNYVRQMSRDVGLGQQLMATVTQGHRRRIYLPPSDGQAAAARVSRPEDVPQGDIFDWPGRINVYRYGMTVWADLFTNRQLVTLTTFSDLVAEVRLRVLADAKAAGMPEGESLEGGGSGAAAYSDAIAVYLAMNISKIADRGSSIVTWVIERESTRNTFARQAIPMAWDFVEPNQFASGTGSWSGALDWTIESLDCLPTHCIPGEALQADALQVDIGDSLISTDPPYYDNIGYSDLSDFFYAWLRRSLRSYLPSLFSTVQVPKTEELVANPYRHGGADGARNFFESGFKSFFARARGSANAAYPITVYYAFKQSETKEEGEVSKGWETLLDGMVSTGWQVTATWPIRSETNNRMTSVGTNALASSIVLALRPRPDSAPGQDRRGFIDALRGELTYALQNLQAGGIAPVDLPQAAIGPGMAVFSRYSTVLEPDGSQMTVRSALARINEVLDEVLSEQEGEFDPTTRFAIAWFRTHGYGEGKYGNADDLARARNTAVEKLERSGILTGRQGVVRLFRPSDLPSGYDIVADESVSAWEALHHLVRIMESEGAPAAGAFLAQAAARADGAIDIDLIPELSHLLFRIAEDNKWTKDAISFNSLVTAWPDIVDASRAPRSGAQQGALDFRADD